LTTTPAVTPPSSDTNKTTTTDVTESPDPAGESKSCEPCAANAYPGPNNRAIYECSECPQEGEVYTPTTVPWTCSCVSTSYTSSYGKCLLNTDLTTLRASYPIETSRTVGYDFVESGSSNSNTLGQVSIAISDTFNYLYYDAAVGCQVYEDPKKCQTLANLCVLQLYYERTSVCQLF
jgi:hypothetical protein